MNKDAIEERIHQFNIKLYDYISVIVVELTKEYMQDINKIYVLKRVLQNFLARNTIVYYKGFLVAIFDTKTDSVFTESDFQQFNVLLEKQTAGPASVIPARTCILFPNSSRRPWPRSIQPGSCIARSASFATATIFCRISS